MKKLFALLLCMLLLVTPVLASGEASGGASPEAVAIADAVVTVDEDYFDGTVTVSLPNGTTPPSSSKTP